MSKMLSQNAVPINPSYDDRPVKRYKDLSSFTQEITKLYDTLGQANITGRPESVISRIKRSIAEAEKAFDDMDAIKF